MIISATSFGYKFGTPHDVDLLSSYRMGSALPFRTEFPLVLHGYFVEEVFAIIGERGKE